MTVTAEALVVAEPSRSGAEPGWLAQLRRAGRERFVTLGLPTRRMEAWKYTDLRALPIASLLTAASESAGGATFTLPSPLSEGRMHHRLVFIDGAFRADLSRIGAMPAGVRIDSLAVAAADVGLLLDVDLGRLAPIDGQPMVALNAAEMQDGIVLRVGRGIEIDQPVEVVFLHGNGEGAAHHPRHLVVLEPGSAATLIEVHAGGGGAAHFANHVTEISIAGDARLRHYALQAAGEGSVTIGTRAVSVATRGRYEAFTLTLGGRLTRNEVRVTLDGSGADCLLAGAYVLRGAEHCDNTLVVEHRVPRTSCRQIYKGIVDERSRGVFQGRLVVHPGAQQTDAHQLSKALLLSEQAEVDQKPELEIYADDVSCSHGAAAGQLDPAQLFYLRSRGVSEARARQLLIAGFLADVFDEIADAAVRTAFIERARTRFDGGLGDAVR